MGGKHQHNTSIYVSLAFQKKNVKNKIEQAAFMDKELLHSLQKTHSR